MVKPIAANRSPLGIAKEADLALSWLSRIYPQLFPQLGQWQNLAVEWITIEKIGRHHKLEALCEFFERYLIQGELPLNPEVFFDKRTELPDFYETVFAKGERGAYQNNYIYHFLNFVLLKHFSRPGLDDTSVILPAFRNPIRQLTRHGVPKTVSKHTDLSLSWLPRKYPQLFPPLEQWHGLAVEWVQEGHRAIGPVIGALIFFFERYLIPQNLPLDPKVFLDMNTRLPDFYQTACPQNSVGITCNTKIHNFLDFVLSKERSHLGSDAPPLLLALRNPVPLLAFRPDGKPILRRKEQKASDMALSWLEQDYPDLFPQLADWRDLAAEWLKQMNRGLPIRIDALILFFERYLIGQHLPLDVNSFFLRGRDFSDFYRTVCHVSILGTQLNNRIHEFLTFVMLKRCSEESDDGQLAISPAFRNPVPRLSSDAGVALDETVRSPLPYGYIYELRQMLAQGQHFRDWEWAQGALGVKAGKKGRVSVGWFPVTEDRIDKNDPDCVWRVRTTHAGIKTLEMWSPVRWVALLAKLIVPLRTFQVRVLDSGESDTWRYENGTWKRNPNPLAEGSEKRPAQRGVFRRVISEASTQANSVVLYINTNKTADAERSGTDKGYLLPWITGGAQYEDIAYWLEKLRNWQEKYNPIRHRTPWTELDARHITTKSEVQLAGYPNNCFLFRLAEAPKNERHLPASGIMLDLAWFKLLEALELRLARRGEKHQNGDPIRLIPPPDKRRSTSTTYFPLHSLRVSLITALALDGQVPFSILQKLVGHSRLLMTLYYVKPSQQYVIDVLRKGVERAEENKEVSIQNFLLNAEYDRLQQEAICNSADGLVAAIPRHPADRNAAGWMMMHHGLCLVGGNTSEIEINGHVGGCFNGGPVVGDPSRKQYGPVPGGNRNCIRCRWFVTKPEYLGALWAQFNNIAYHFDEALKTLRSVNEELVELQKRKANAEEKGTPFAEMPTFRQIERLSETAAKNVDNLALDLAACVRLMKRCVDAANARQGSGTQLIAVGSPADLQMAFEETESELLQLEGVCEDVEIFPDLDPGKAVVRRSQLLDKVLYNNDFQPFFIHLDEKQQLLIGNAFMRDLGRKMNPSNPMIGQREVISLMDAGQKLSQCFGVELNALLPGVEQSRLS